MRRTTAMAIVAVLLVGLVGVPPTTALANHCWVTVDVERRPNGEVAGYHALSCWPKSYRLRVYFEGLHCNSKKRRDCFDISSRARIVYSSWKQCFNTVFCRARRVMADRATPGSWYCVYGQGLIENPKGGSIERTDRYWKCEYMG